MARSVIRWLRGATIGAAIAATCCPAAADGPAGQLWINGSNQAYLPGSPSGLVIAPSLMPAFTGGDCVSSAGTINLACTKTNGVAFSFFATLGNLSGDVATAGSGATTIQPGVVTNPKMAAGAAAANLLTSGITNGTTATTQPTGDGSTKVATDAFVLANSTTSAVLRGYLSGLTLSNDATTPNTVLDISAGVAQGSDNATMISLGAFTKTIGGAWVAGTGNAGMGNGLTAAANTWYNVCLAYNGGTPDVYFDTSVTCANKPTGISGSIYRRLGSILTDGSIHIIGFWQVGDDFNWNAKVTDINAAAIPTTATLYSLTVPPGVRVKALLNASFNVSNVGGDFILYSPGDITQNQVWNSPSTGVFAYTLQVYTDTSRRVSLTSGNTANALTLYTYGWTDRRGRFD